MTLIVDFPERRAQFDDFTWGKKAALEKVNVAFREGPEPYEGGLSPELRVIYR